MFPRLPSNAGGGSTESATIESTTIPNIDDSINYMLDTDWWANAIEDDTFFSPLPFDASENGLWNGRFVPPPPRPPFLDETVSSDGLTTCDLCTWAWNNEKNAFSLDGTIAETAGELGWTFTLITVSLISALLGAIIMIIVLRCKRLKSSNSNGRQLPWWYRSQRNSSTSNNGSRNNMLTKHPNDSIRGTSHQLQHHGTLNLTAANLSANGSPINASSPNSANSGVWTWLTNRRQPSAPEQLGSPQHHLHPSTQENHYTHMDDTYSPVGITFGAHLGSHPGLGPVHFMRDSSGVCLGGISGGDNDSADMEIGIDSVGEALYAELDRESVQSGTNPSYQNTAYSQCGENDNDMPMVSSAPSSAYYSDLSVTAVPTERAYEIVGLNVLSPNWASSSTEIHPHHHHAPNPQNLLNDAGHSSSSGNHSNTSSISSNQSHSGANISSSNIVLTNRPIRPNRLSAINESTSIPSDYV